MSGIRKGNFRREREFDISICKGHDNAFSEYTSVGRVFPYAVLSDKEKSTTRLCHDSSSSRYSNILSTSIAPATTDVSFFSVWNAYHDSEKVYILNYNYIHYPVFDSDYNPLFDFP